MIMNVPADGGIDKVLPAFHSDSPKARLTCCTLLPFSKEL